jgi:hypothetical protein
MGRRQSPRTRDTIAQRRSGGQALQIHRRHPEFGRSCCDIVFTSTHASLVGEVGGCTGQRSPRKCGCISSPHLHDAASAAHPWMRQIFSCARKNAYGTTALAAALPSIYPPSPIPGPLRPRHRLAHPPAPTRDLIPSIPALWAVCRIPV